MNLSTALNDKQSDHVKNQLAQMELGKGFLEHFLWSINAYNRIYLASSDFV